MNQTPETGIRAPDAALRVLVLGDDDACRAVMAAAFLRALSGGKIDPASAGVRRRGVDPAAVAVMAEAGIGVAGKTPVHVSELAGPFDLVITVGERARGFLRGPDARTAPPTGDEPRCSNVVLYLGAPIHLHWTLPPPPHGEPEGDARPAYRAIRDAVLAHVRAFLDHGYFPALVAQRQTLERLVDALEDGVLVHDEKRRITLFNRAAERITGYRREDVLGKECFAVFDPDGLCGGACRVGGRRSTADRPAAERSAAGRSVGEIPFTTAHGEDRRLRLTATPMAGADGEPGGLLVVLRDVTEVATLRERVRARGRFHGMIGNTPAMEDVFEMVRRVTASDYPVLITGESGTGKEMVAGAIHQESRRQGAPFVAINCGALPEPLLESELFGHVRGAFTGAVRDKKGRFELADGGTIFLDEIGELTPAFQVKLLRVLEEKRFERVGSEQTVAVDVRVVAATNRDLSEMVRRGAFREDLYYRLAVVPIRLPPLRARREDLPALVEKILGDVREETGKPIRAVSDAAMDLLLAYRWPGNIRELINALRSAAVRCAGETIEPAHLPPDVRAAATFADAPDGDVSPASAPETGRRRKLDPAAVDRALSATRGNKVRAARLLGVGRATLYRFLGETGKTG
jgi:PAS domain S-box-containing protein